jgi:hypothetical protein
MQVLQSVHKKGILDTQQNPYTVHFHDQPIAMLYEILDQQEIVLA